MIDWWWLPIVWLLTIAGCLVAFTMCVVSSRVEVEIVEAQPDPSPGQEDVTESLIARIRQRQQKGIETYGTTLQTFNGRNPVEDAIDECLDLAQYLMQWNLEREELMQRINGA